MLVEHVLAMTVLWFAFFSVFLPLNAIPEDEYRYLPQTVRPIRYYLTLEAHPDRDLTFTGSVSIDLKTLINTRNITLHSKNLKIPPRGVQVITEKQEKIPVVTTQFKDKDLFIVHLGQELIAGRRYQLLINKFTGIYTEGNFGFFLAKYEVQGKERTIALTYFEPSGARLAFPCFDEPGLKARFVVNLIRSNVYHTVSNSELERSIVLGDGRVQDVYKETVAMATYLVAFAIIDYSYTKQNQRVRVLARRDAIQLGNADYILTESNRLLKAMEEYTGINYAMDKVDLLGVPKDYFIDGAMENWGLIIYSESHLLYSTINSTTEDLQRCTTYTAHELSHQWFGNLVTPSKWNYMWLSEGFAAFFQYYLADIVEPTWRLKEQFVVDEMQKSLSGDLEPMAEPINYIFQDPDQFPSAWVYYYKASSVIRMMEHVLTPPVFRRGLKLYLEKKKFSSSVPEDLYQALQRAVKKAGAQNLLGPLTVSQIFSTWDTNVGYPLVTAVRNYTSGTITLTQETYTNSDSATQSTWIIPISYATNINQASDFTKTTADLWLTEKTITFNSFKGINWVLLNKQHAGYFRVNYDLMNWNRLSKFLRTSKFKTIDVLNRAQLINDAFQLMEDGKLSVQIPMELIVYVKQETDYTALKPFITRINSLDFMVSVTDQYQTYKTYVKHLLNKAFTKIGLEEKPEDSHVDKLARVILAKKMCAYGDSHCQNFGLERLRAWKRTGTFQVWSEIEYDVLCGAVQVADIHDWNFLLIQYYSTSDSDKKSMYIKALGCSQNPNIRTMFLDRIYDFENDITTPDRVSALVSMLETRILGVETIVKYLIGKKIPSNSSFEDLINDSVIHQIISSRFIREVEALTNSGNGKYLPASLFTEDYLEEFEQQYITGVSRWLSKRNNFSGVGNAVMFRKLN